MSSNGCRFGCRRKGHRGTAAHRMAIYDSLPREVRDKIKIANSPLCCGCIRADLRRDGLEAVLRELDIRRERGRRP
jgi:hypothetical protein